jgi:hypothetical protein
MALETKFDKTTVLMDRLPSPSYCRGYRNKRSTRRQHRFQQSEGNSDSSKSIGVKFRCENRSTEKIKCIKAELIETIEWCANGHTETSKTTLASSTLDAGMYPELDTMWHKPFSWQEHRHQNNINTEGLLVKPWRTIHPSLGVEAAMATDTYRGRAVQVRHVLSVKAITHGQQRQATTATNHPPGYICSLRGRSVRPFNATTSHGSIERLRQQDE